MRYVKVRCTGRQAGWQAARTSSWQGEGVSSMHGHDSQKEDESRACTYMMTVFLGTFVSCSVTTKKTVGTATITDQQRLGAELSGVDSVVV